MISQVRHQGPTESGRRRLRRPKTDASRWVLPDRGGEGEAVPAGRALPVAGNRESRTRTIWTPHPNAWLASLCELLHHARAIELLGLARRHGVWRCRIAWHI